jgi:hypothetical protein
MRKSKQTKPKRPMTEAQKKALATGRAKRHEQMKNPGKSAPTKPAASKTASEEPKAQEGAKESKPAPVKRKAPKPSTKRLVPTPGVPSEGRRLTADTVLFPLPDPTKAVEQSPTAVAAEGIETDEMVDAREALYGDENWTVVIGNKVDTTGAADECVDRAMVARLREKLTDVRVVDPSGNAIDPEKEKEASRLAKEARSWRVERQNGGACTVMYKGKMPGALKAFEREYDRAAGCTVVLFNGRAEPVDQVCKPQFRTTINGPDNEIVVDSESYKKYIAPAEADAMQGDSKPDKPDAAPGAGRCDAQAPAAAAGCQPDAPDWTGAIPADFSGVENLKLPEERNFGCQVRPAKLAGRDADIVELENVGAAIAHCRTMLTYLEQRDRVLREKVVGRMTHGSPDAAADSMHAIIRGLR